MCQTKQARSLHSSDLLSGLDYFQNWPIKSQVSKTAGPCKPVIPKYYLMYIGLVALWIVVGFTCGLPNASKFREEAEL